MQILLTGAFSYTEPQLQKLEQLGLTPVWMPEESGALPAQAKDAEAVVCNGLFLHHDLSEFPRLRFVQLTSAGLDRVPVSRMQKMGIALRNARGVYSIPMAEFALWGVLSLYKHADFFAANQKAHVWEKDRTLLELAGKTVLIVGFGSVGAACAKRFRAFDTTVLAADLQRPDGGFDAFYPMERLPEALARADVVVLTLPLTEQTRGMFGEALFSVCKPGAVLVNISRGAVVQEAALAAALQNGPLGGAVLDVFQAEPLPAESPLWDMPNVLATPHNSFVSEQNRGRLFALIYQNLRDFLKGEAGA